MTEKRGFPSISYGAMAREVLLLVGLSVGLALAVNAVSSRGIALIGQWDTAKGVVTADPDRDGFFGGPEITDPETAKLLYDTGLAVFVDARREEDFNEGHIQGAVSMPLGFFDDLIGGFAGAYPPESMIITYCSGRTCMDSHHLAQRLVERGYVDVSVFIDGYAAWEEKGFPIECTEKAVHE